MGGKIDNRKTRTNTEGAVGASFFLYENINNYVIGIRVK